MRYLDRRAGGIEKVLRKRKNREKPDFTRVQRSLHRSVSQSS